MPSLVFTDLIYERMVKTSSSASQPSHYQDTNADYG